MDHEPSRNQPAPADAPPARKPMPEPLPLEFQTYIEKGTGPKRPAPLPDVTKHG